MTPSDDSNTEGKVLLERVLADPFVARSGKEAHAPPAYVWEWFQYLRQRFPLWAFQADEYLKFHSSALATTYPLAQFVYSMLLDEGVKASVPLDPLPAEVEQRRLDLADPTGIQLPAWQATHAQRYGQPRVSNRPLPRFAPDRVSALPLDGSLRGPRFNSFYEELGFDLHPLIDEVRFALNSARRRRAWRDLLQFIEGYWGHRPPEGPPKALLKALAAQGTDLVALLWSVLPFDVSQEARERLHTEGVLNSDMHTWAARLALPVFSACEIEALLSAKARKTAHTKRRGTRPTKQRWAIWLIAHRLGGGAPMIARKTLYTNAERYFKGRANPIDRVCSRQQAAKTLQ